MGGSTVSLKRPAAWFSGRSSSKLREARAASTSARSLSRGHSSRACCSAMDESGGSFSPELKDLETKLGRKVPDGLVRSLLAGGKRNEKSPHLSSCKFCADSADLERLQSKMLVLRQEMVSFSQVFLRFRVC